MDTPSPQVIELSVRNLSTVVQRSELKAAFAAFMQQANNDLHKHWENHPPDRTHQYVPFVSRIRELPTGEVWPRSKKGSPASWRATIFDYPYQAMSDDDTKLIPVEALGGVGYHYLDGDVPHMVVFAASALQSGIPWTLTFSHELLESLTDPWTDGVLDDDYELEICDPVQYDAYPIDGVWVSNFVTPGWFQVTARRRSAAAAAAFRYDFANRLSSPRERTLGGTRTRRGPDGRDMSETLTPGGELESQGG
jgi:hypothetical protein